MEQYFAQLADNKPKSKDGGPANEKNKKGDEDKKKPSESDGNKGKDKDEEEPKAKKEDSPPHNLNTTASALSGPLRIKKTKDGVVMQQDIFRT